MAVQRLIICTPSQERLHHELRELGIPPHPFLRRDIVVVSSLGDAEKARGMGSGAWTSVPGFYPPAQVHSGLAALRGVPHNEWHRAIARVLAWRQYHEC